MPLDSLQTLFPMPPPRHNRKRKRRRQKRTVPCLPGLETTAPRRRRRRRRRWTRSRRSTAARPRAPTRARRARARARALAAHDERPRRAPFVVRQEARLRHGAREMHDAAARGGGLRADAVRRGRLPRPRARPAPLRRRRRERRRRGARARRARRGALPARRPVVSGHRAGRVRPGRRRRGVRRRRLRGRRRARRRAAAGARGRPQGRAPRGRRRPRGRGGARGGGARAGAAAPRRARDHRRAARHLALVRRGRPAAARLGPTVSDVLRRGGERAGERPPEPVALLLAAGVMAPSCRATRRACSTATSSPTTSCSGRPPPAPPAPPRPATATRPRRWRRRGAATASSSRTSGGVDRRRHRAGTQFSTALDHAHLAAFEWPPARADRRRAPRPRAPWVHEIDTYAVGVCLHLIATGAWPTRDGRRQGTPPRAWDRDLWTSLIDAHLHTDPDAGAPSLARRRAFVAATRAALDARRFEDLDAELRRWCRRAAG